MAGEEWGNRAWLRMDRGMGRTTSRVKAGWMTGLGVVRTTVLTENSSFSLNPTAFCGCEQSLRPGQAEQHL